MSNLIYFTIFLIFIFLIFLIKKAINRGIKAKKVIKNIEKKITEN